MENFLTGLLRLSLLGSLLTALLLLLRPLLRGRVSRAASYYIWLLVLLRLCVPLGVTLSLPEVPDVPAVTPAPSAPSLSGGSVSRPAPSISQDSPLVVPSVPTPVSPPQVPEAPEAPGWAELVDWSIPLAALWAAGAVTCLGWHAGCYRLFSRNVKKHCLPPSPLALEVLDELDPAERVGLAECPLVNTPMLLGAVHPVIVLPVGITDRGQLEDILAHELTHQRRHDLAYKWFAVAVTCLHWFNPVMLLVRREIGRCCELSCDEAVVGKLDGERRRRYGQTLLDLAAAPPSGLGLLAVTLCEEKKQLKERLISIVNYRKKGMAAVLLTLLLVLSVGGCALVSAAEIVSAPGEGNIQPGESDPLTVVNPPASSGASGTSGSAAAQVPEGVPADFWSILTGQAGFVHVTGEGYHWNRDIHSVSGVFPSDLENQVWAYALADLDGDGTEELILHIIAAAGDMGGFELLRREADGQIYGYPTNYKAISELKADGTFTWTSLTGYEWGAGRLTFNETGYEVQSFLYGSAVPGEDPVWLVDGQSVREEDYSAAARVQAEKPDAVWQELPAVREPEHGGLTTLWGVDVDGDGLADTVTAFSDWYNEMDDAGSTTLQVTLSTGAVLEKQWEDGGFLSLAAAPLTTPGRSAIVLERTNLTSNYGAAEFYVLEVVNGALEESLTLDNRRQWELGLNLTMGFELVQQEDSQLQALRVPHLVGKWVGHEWQTFRYTAQGWVHERDGFFADTIDLTVTGGRRLTLTALGPLDQPMENLIKYYDRLQIWDGDTLLQVITADDVVRDENYLFEGLLFSWSTTGIWWEDVNFDGADDFGVPCGTSYNGPICWFVWDDAVQQFRFGFFSSLDLRVDWDARQLTDVWRDGNLGADYYIYEYDSQGQCVLVDHYFGRID